MKKPHYSILISTISLVMLLGFFVPSNVFAVEYDSHEDPFYNIGIEIEKHYKIFADIDKSEFPDRTYYSRWYDGWDKWIQMGVQHDVGQKIDLENFREVSKYFENYQRQWCIDSIDEPIFFDVPVDTGFISCLEIKNFEFAEKTIDGRHAYSVTYEWHEKWRYASHDGTLTGKTETEWWIVYVNLIPYGDDLVVVFGETTNPSNTPYNKKILSHTIDSFKILNDGQPIFHETMAPILDELKIDEKPKAPTTKPLAMKKPVITKIPVITETYSELISLEIDQSLGLLQRDFITYIKIFGEVEDYLRGVRILLSVTDPDGITTVQKLIGTKDGYFENYLWFGDDVVAGVYTITAQFRNEISPTNSFEISWPAEFFSSAQSSTESIMNIPGGSTLSQKELVLRGVTYDFLDDCNYPEIKEAFDDIYLSWGILQKTHSFRVSLDEGEFKKVILDCNDKSIIFTTSSPKYDSMVIKIRTPDYTVSNGYAKVLSVFVNDKKITHTYSTATAIGGEANAVISLPYGTDNVKITNFKILPDAKTEPSVNIVPESIPIAKPKPIPNITSEPTPNKFPLAPTTSQITSKKIPDWIKNNAKWWSDGQLGDDEFVGGLQHMIKEKIINIDNLPPSSESTTTKIPDWIKTNAGWWASGTISEDDFIGGIKYLVQKGIIQIN
ncbi:MAG: hypothetical protein COA77_00180 [Thaumarchaeota archaeon]|nr:MAG: hypothetical protein COA77_00180 [Nitrososphaerota archaeon]